MNPRHPSRLHPTLRLAVFAGLPIAVIMASAWVASAAWKSDLSWIGAKKPVQSQKLLDNLNELESRLAAIEIAQGAEPSCPRGYAKAADPNPTIIVCK